MKRMLQLRNNACLMWTTMLFVPKLNVAIKSAHVKLELCIIIAVVFTDFGSELNWSTGVKDGQRIRLCLVRLYFLFLLGV